MNNPGKFEVHSTIEAPLMALSSATLFPHTLMPLRIFEPRYRQMLQWCLEHERMFCVVQLKPGNDETNFHPVSGLGLIRACVGREDGTSDLVLLGLTRVEFVRMTQEHPFRMAQFREWHAPVPSPVEMQALESELTILRKLLTRQGIKLPAAITEDAMPAPPDVLADLVAHNCLRDPLRRQDVLNTSNITLRLRILIQHLQHEMPPQ